jgi:hypothetical protein
MYLQEATPPTASVDPGQDQSLHQEEIETENALDLLDEAKIVATRHLQRLPTMTRRKNTLPLENRVAEEEDECIMN